MRRAFCLLAFLLAAPVAAQACADNARRLVGIVESDVQLGNVARSVGQRLIADLNTAAGHCSAGRMREGEAIIARIRRDYSYR